MYWQCDQFYVYMWGGGGGGEGRGEELKYRTVYGLQ